MPGSRDARGRSMRLLRYRERVAMYDLGERLEVRCNIEGRDFMFETGAVAKQADGAVLVSFGESMVLVTATASHTIREGIDFFPMVVDYQEMAYAAGKIPGGFFKREGRPSEKEILTARLIDRPLRPLFPKGFLNEVQIIATVLSADQENDTDVLAICGASAALQISDIPFKGPIAGVRVGRVKGQWVSNPTRSQLQESDVNLIVAGNRDGVVMVEGGGQELSEDDLLDAIFFGHRALQPILDIQEELKKKCIESENGRRRKAGEAEISTIEKRTVPEATLDSVLGQSVLLKDESLRGRIRAASEKIQQALSISRKKIAQRTAGEGAAGDPGPPAGRNFRSRPGRSRPTMRPWKNLFFASPFSRKTGGSTGGPLTRSAPFTSRWGGFPGPMVRPGLPGERPRFPRWSPWDRRTTSRRSMPSRERLSNPSCSITIFHPTA